MRPELHRDIINRLAEFGFKNPKNGWLHGGKCPSCGKKELYTHYDNPWVLRCNRINNCGYEAHIKDIYPDLFNSWSDRYQPCPENGHNPNAAADAYLAQARGFDLDRIKGWYSQESYYDSRKNIGSATVRFPACGSWWERIIDKPERFDGAKARFAPGSKYKGLWWAPPSAVLSDAKEIWICEGIFNAIALWHHGIIAVSIMSCTNYPETALNKLKEECGDAWPSLIWALDNDKAGKESAVKFKERATKEGWLCAIAVPPAGKDWNDLHLLDWGKLSDEKIHLSSEALDKYKFEGRILSASTAAEKGVLIYQKQSFKQDFDFEFQNRWYWFSLDFDKYNKLRDQYSDLDEKESQEKALMESNSIRTIANCYPEPLYYQQNKVTDESWYYYQVSFPHQGASVKNTFTASQLSTASEFKKRLLSIAAGAVFTGTNKMLESVIERKLYNIKRVETVDFVGYSKEFKTYVFNKLAVSEGKIYRLNKEDFFDIGRLPLKTLNSSVQLDINDDPSGYKRGWFQHLWLTYGEKGVVALAFWFGTLFSEQIREMHRSYPFLEIVGDAGTGKTAIIEFLWKLLGRDYEGFDPSKSSLAARSRNFVQVAGLPVVLIESDRESATGQSVKSFDWDELKTAYNGRSIRARGVATSGNETYEPPFRGSIVIAQNNPVNSSEAIMQRICHLYFSREDTTEQSSKSIKELQAYSIEDVSGFILSATTKEDKVLEIMANNTEAYQKQLLEHPAISIPRIALNHAQLLSLLDALCLVVNLSEKQKELTQAYITDMAIKRQEAVSDDHPIVNEFWEMFEYLNGENPDKPVLNHATDPSTIAVNLNEFIQLAVECRQQVPSLRELKAHLKNSRKHKYMGQACVYSKIRAHNTNYNSTSIRAWIFQK